jgi:hypothetical protein
MVLGFWDIAPIIYLVGLVISFVLVHDRLARPECYRIPFALFVAAMWPIALAIMAALALESLLYTIKEWIVGEEE